MKADVREEIEMPEGVEAKLDDFLAVKGPKGENKKKLKSPKVTLGLVDGKIVLESKKATKREKKLLNTFAAHIKNMIKGVTEGHFYELKICSGHFPMNVSVSGDELVIKNFLGENSPRKTKLNPGVKVTVEGDKIRVESASKELAGQTAANIEKLTKIKARDRRIFQDGIFIVNKDGKELL